MLFDLTSLQREANGRFGFPARMTLSLAQALYEKHKVLTYPRTDSRALPEDYLPTVKDTLKQLGGTDAFGTYARQVLKQVPVTPPAGSSSEPIECVHAQVLFRNRRPATAHRLRCAIVTSPRWQ